MPYTFCESVTASGLSPWHLRQLTDTGRHLGGGVDTPSLCGQVKPPYGWDLKVELTPHHLSHVCKTCLAEYVQRKDKP